MFYIPTKVVSGVGCLRDSLADIRALGIHAVFVVTSASAGILSGALDDVRHVCETMSLPMRVFDGIGQNPDIADCREAGRQAHEFGADCILGIGGGSPLDAAKAVAAFAIRPDMPAMSLYNWGDKPTLPILAVPTTAGTGSETNSFSVLTVDNGARKLTYKGPQNFPKLAFLDPRYTASLPDTYAMATALDALCHAVESYLTPFATPVTEALSLRAARDLWRGVLALRQGPPDEALRFSLLKVSCMAGMAIQHTGTGMPHPMGYALSLNYGLPHGSACALFLPAHLHMLMGVVPNRVETVLAAMEMDLTTLTETLSRLHGFGKVLTDEEILRYVGLVASSVQLHNGHVTVAPEQMTALYRQLPATPIL